MLAVSKDNLSNLFVLIGHIFFFLFCIRFLDGVAYAAAWTSVTSILICMFPNNIASVLSWTELLTGLGNIIGMCTAEFEPSDIKINDALQCSSIKS